MADGTRLWAGIDLGGTGTRVVLVDDGGREVAGTTGSTASFAGDATGRLAGLVRGLVPGGALLAGIGIGASGPVDLRTGEIRNPDTLPWFTGQPVAPELERLLGAPAWIDNDAVAAGLAEAAWGEAAAFGSCLCVTLGTGVGAVLIAGGRPIRAADGQHPEGGHIPVAGTGSPCYCGLPQCWEQVASRRALEGLLAGRAADAPEAADAWDAYAAAVASGLITLITLYHPACIVIGGSVARHWSRLGGRLIVALEGFREYDPSVPLFASTLGERGGALGATVLAQRGIGWRQAPGDPVVAEDSLRAGDQLLAED